MSITTSTHSIDQTVTEHRMMDVSSFLSRVRHLVLTTSNRHLAAEYYRIDDHLVDVIVALDARELPAVALRWAQSELPAARHRPPYTPAETSQIAALISDDTNRCPTLSSQQRLEALVAWMTSLYPPDTDYRGGAK